MYLIKLGLTFRGLWRFRRLSKLDWCQVGFSHSYTTQNPGNHVYPTGHREGLLLQPVINKVLSDIRILVRG
jgi:hypothetical protein